MSPVVVAPHDRPPGLDAIRGHVDDLGAWLATPTPPPPQQQGSDPWSVSRGRGGGGDRR
jgi:hypothetical protein